MCGETFSEFLVKKRDTVGLSNSRLAALSGMSAVYLGEIVRNKKGPPDKKIQYALAEALNLTVDEKLKFYDLAARERGEIPIDVYDHLLESPELIEEIRAKKYGKREL